MINLVGGYKVVTYDTVICLSEGRK